MNPALARHGHRDRRSGDLRRARALPAVGGFPDQPLMEDIELSRRLEARRRCAGLPAQRVVTSAGAGSAHGPCETVLAMWRWRFAYWRGADPVDLAAEYETGRGPLAV